jgi:hypothetical protein
MIQKETDMKKIILSLAALAIVLWTATSFAGELSFTFVNKAGKTIQELYLATPGSYKWGDNLLTAGKLEDGASAPIKYTSEDGVTSWDLKIIDAEDNSREWEQISLKGISVLTLFVRDGILTIKKE